ncbi:hypothetical protein CC2G_015012 [Coprinopsis cinerea AmutBmut pab1-1]|nr:hypothetical protein CC2G_015012 [Coprinopsis cinerea AmutBmut pab1-1]
MGTEVQKTDRVVVFWDWESIGIGRRRADLSSELISTVHDIAKKFGPVVSVQAYLSVSSVPEDTRKLLLDSGVTLRDCPRSKSEIAGKKIITDILLYAFDGWRNNYGSITFVLVTGDPGFSYTLSLLRDRRYGVVVISSNPEPDLFAHSIPIYAWADVVEKAELLRLHRQTVPHLGVGPVAKETSSKPWLLTKHRAVSESVTAYPEIEPPQSQHPTSLEADNLSEQQAWPLVDGTEELQEVYDTLHEDDVGSATKDFEAEDAVEFTVSEEEEPVDYANPSDWEIRGGHLGTSVEGEEGHEEVYTGDEEVYAGDEEVYTGDEEVYTGDEDVYIEYIEDEDVYNGNQDVYTGEGEEEHDHEAHDVKKDQCNDDYVEHAVGEDRYNEDHGEHDGEEDQHVNEAGVHDVEGDGYEDVYGVLHGDDGGEYDDSGVYTAPEEVPEEVAVDPEDFSSQEESWKEYADVGDYEEPSEGGVSPENDTLNYELEDSQRLFADGASFSRAAEEDIDYGVNEANAYDDASTEESVGRPEPSPLDAKTETTPAEFPDAFRSAKRRRTEY